MRGYCGVEDDRTGDDPDNLKCAPSLFIGVCDSREWIELMVIQYFVMVAPGVDLALIAAVCICFDESKNENNN